jgi:hypothetical protein
MTETIAVLRALHKALCPNGMIALQVGGVGNLDPTEDGVTRIVIIDNYGDLWQGLTVTDDEWEQPDNLVREATRLILEQREEDHGASREVPHRSS